MSGKIISRDPEILGGMPVFAGTRVPVSILLEYLEGEYSLDEFLDDYPSVTREMAVALLQLAQRGLAKQFGEVAV